MSVQFEPISMEDSHYKLKTPPFRADKLAQLDPKSLENPAVIHALHKANDQYLHWDELQYKAWIPKEVFPDKELFWTLVKFSRKTDSRPTPIMDVTGNYFRISINPSLQKFLHIIDKEMAGNYMGIANISEIDKKQFIARNIIEESIASSQLEGANTSRSVAKKMLQERRAPHNSSEQMIVNNHQTMQRIESDFCKQPLSWDLICELHAMITYKTLAEKDRGKLRETFDKEGKRLVIKPWDDKTVTYTVPDKEFVEAQIPKLIKFANESAIEEPKFIHPLLRAFMLHFWVGLLHPFEDGNGRLARILFYWYMLKNEYWAFSYVSISEKIKKSPKQYAMAYVYSEQDDYDLTYFINYNVNKLKLAREEFQNYLKNIINEKQATHVALKVNYGLNERQLKVLHYLNQEAERHTNINTHMTIFSIKKGTAINDLKQLVEKKFLTKQKSRRNVNYYLTKKGKNFFNK